jgi:hypothetical protein
MYTVALPLTEAEVAVLEAMAAAAPLPVGELIAVLVREELAAPVPRVPTLG